MAFLPLSLSSAIKQTPSTALPHTGASSCQTKMCNHGIWETPSHMCSSHLRCSESVVCLFPLGSWREFSLLSVFSIFNWTSGRIAMFWGLFASWFPPGTFKAFFETQRWCEDFSHNLSPQLLPRVARSQLKHNPRKYKPQQCKTQKTDFHLFVFPPSYFSQDFDSPDTIFLHPQRWQSCLMPCHPDTVKIPCSLHLKLKTEAVCVHSLFQN